MFKRDHQWHIQHLPTLKTHNSKDKSNLKVIWAWHKCELSLYTYLLFSSLQSCALSEIFCRHCVFFPLRMYHDATNFDQFSGALLLDAKEHSNDGLSLFHWEDHYRYTHRKYHARLECAVDTLDQDQYWLLLDAILCKLPGDRGDSALHSHLEDLSRAFWYFCRWLVLRSVVHFKIYENHNIALDV